MSTLDHIAVSIELTLISIIEGLALQSLAGSAVPVLNHPQLYMYIPYVLAGLLFLLVFWSQSILHAVSFIRWPIRVGHMFLYFCAAFVQVIAYSDLMNTTAWFFWWSVFSAIVVILYVVDLQLIKDSRATFDAIEGGRAFLTEVERRHLYELKTLVPMAFLCNLVILGLILYYPVLLANMAYVMYIGIFQTIVTLFGLWDSMHNFKARSAFIGKLLHEP